MSEDRKLGLISLAAWTLMHIIGHTARFKVVGYERVTELVKSGSGFILAVWHGRTLMPVHYCRGMGIWAITSLSRDGELQTSIVSRFGYRRYEARPGGVRSRRRWGRARGSRREAFSPSRPTARKALSMKSSRGSSSWRRGWGALSSQSGSGRGLGGS